MTESIIARREELILLRRRLTIGLGSSGMLAMMVVCLILSYNPAAVLARSAMAFFGFGVLGFVLGTVILVASLGLADEEQKEREKEEAEAKHLTVKGAEVIGFPLTMEDLQVGMRLTEDITEAPPPGRATGRTLLKASRILTAADLEKIKNGNIQTVRVEGLRYVSETTD